VVPFGGEPFLFGMLSIVTRLHSPSNLNSIVELSQAR
jgi:hypothetical protein